MDYTTAIALLNHPLFVIFGKLSGLLAIVAIVTKVGLFFWGVTPLAIRFGNALTNRKIGIVGSGARFSEIQAILTDSKIFTQKNIVHITGVAQDKVKDMELVIVDWESSEVPIDSIFNAKKSYQVGVIVLAKHGSLKPEEMTLIANRANTVVVNFLGRLLNDAVTSLITTHFANA
jgi:hypothetical protein